MSARASMYTDFRLQPLRKEPMRTFVALLTLLLMNASSRAAAIGRETGPPCRDGIEAICKAFADQSSENRGTRLHQALEAGCASADAKTRTNTFYFVADHWREIDPRRHSESVLAYDKEHGWADGQILLEEAELYYASREVRRSVYARAMMLGETTLGKARVLTAAEAASLAAEQGFSELQRQIEGVLRSLPDQRRDGETDKIEHVRLLLDLFGGGENAQDCDRRGIQKVEDWSAAALAQRLEESATLRLVIGDLARRTCGEAWEQRKFESVECKKIGAVLRDQGELLAGETERRVRESRRRKGESTTSTVAAQRTSWLQSVLREVNRGR